MLLHRYVNFYNQLQSEIYFNSSSVYSISQDTLSESQVTKNIISRCRISARRISSNSGSGKFRLCG